MGDRLLLDAQLVSTDELERRKSEYASMERDDVF